MKYCKRCGAELVDEAVVYVKCDLASSFVGEIFKSLISLVKLILGVVGLVYSIPTFGPAMRSERIGAMLWAEILLVISVILIINGGVELKKSGKSDNEKVIFEKRLSFVRWIFYILLIVVFVLLNWRWILGVFQ